MFIECKYFGALGHCDKGSRWQVKVIDTEFEEVVEVIFNSACQFETELIYPIIDVYEKRRATVNVAANLAAAIRWFDSREDSLKSAAQKTIDWHKAHNPRYAKYASDIEKYLILV